MRSFFAPTWPSGCKNAGTTSLKWTTALMPSRKLERTLQSRLRLSISECRIWMACRRSKRSRVFDRPYRPSCLPGMVPSIRQRKQDVWMPSSSCKNPARSKSSRRPLRRPKPKLGMRAHGTKSPIGSKVVPGASGSWEATIRGRCSSCWVWPSLRHLSTRQLPTGFSSCSVPKSPDPLRSQNTQTSFLDTPPTGRWPRVIRLQATTARNTDSKRKCSSQTEPSRNSRFLPKT